LPALFAEHRARPLPTERHAEQRTPAVGDLERADREEGSRRRFRTAGVGHESVPRYAAWTAALRRISPEFPAMLRPKSSTVTVGQAEHHLDVVLDEHERDAVVAQLPEHVDERVRLRGVEPR
jgi:hypothetical protein